MSKEIQHSVDCLQLNGYVGEPIGDVIAELRALRLAAKQKGLRNVRVLIGQRTDLAELDTSIRVNPKLRMFVVGEVGQ